MFSELSDGERDLVLRCWKCAIRGELFPLEQAEQYIGMTAEDLGRVIRSYPIIGDERYDNHGFLALDLGLSTAASVRSERDLPGIPESPSEIDAVRLKAVGGK